MIMVFGEFLRQWQSGLDAIGPVNGDCIHGHAEENRVTRLRSTERCIRQILWASQPYISSPWWEVELVSAVYSWWSRCRRSSRLGNSRHSSPKRATRQCFDMLQEWRNGNFSGTESRSFMLPDSVLIGCFFSTRWRATVVAHPDLSRSKFPSAPNAVIYLHTPRMGSSYDRYFKALPMPMSSRISSNNFFNTATDGRSQNLFSLWTTSNGEVWADVLRCRCWTYISHLIPRIWTPSRSSSPS